MTNDVESPIFEKAGVNYKAPVTLNFTSDRPVRSIFGRDKNDARNRINIVQFMDRDGAQINEFNPGNVEGNEENGSTHQIAENEALIGFYGVKDKEDWFTTFGFIVKVKDF